MCADCAFIWGGRKELTADGGYNSEDQSRISYKCSHIITHQLAFIVYKEDRVSTAAAAAVASALNTFNDQYCVYLSL